MLSKFRTINVALDGLQQLKKELVVNDENAGMKNMFVYAPSRGEMLEEDIHVELNIFVYEVLSFYKEVLKGCCFYCWFDEMAAQLRFSAIRNGMPMPFRRKIARASHIDEIVALSISRWKDIYDIHNNEGGVVDGKDLLVYVCDGVNES